MIAEFDDICDDLSLPGVDLNSDLDMDLFASASQLILANDVMTLQEQASRIVSLEALADADKATTLSSAPTPWLTLKLLAKSKRERDFTPSVLREALYNKSTESTEERPKKKSKVVFSDESALHKACCNPNVSAADIDQILRMEPSAASKPATLRTVKREYNAVSGNVEEKLIKEPYNYALNLAITNNVSSEVLEMLINAAPSVLTLKDGSAQASSLAILIKHRPNDVATVDKIILKKPKCVLIKDRHENNVAHVAATSGACLRMMRHIIIMFPESLDMRNFHDKTPLQLAQQSVRCREEVAAFMLEQQA